jgi:endonuclease/exonuclease/phosphatase family metal-dependent hydrolase
MGVESRRFGRGTLTIVTYNISYLSGLTNNQSVERTRQLFDANQAQAIAALQPLNADLIALQEVDLDSARSLRVDQVEAMAEALDFPQAGIALNKVKLDYIFYTPETIEAIEAQVVSEAEQASDHLPVMLRFRFK